jgi:O-antigen ligase
MQTIFKDPSRIVALSAAAIVTAAAFGKLFVPFYLIGSTAIFVVLSVAGVALIALDWRSIRNQANYAGDVLVMIGALYALVIASYLVNSLHQVPPTHLLGILIFHGLFLVFGFATARAPKAVFAMLLAQAAVYLIFLVRYAVRFGDVFKDGFLRDVFGVGDGALAIALHQHIGIAFGLAVLAGLGFGTRWTRLASIAALPFVLLFMFHIGTRTAIVALSCGLLFLLWADFWGRSRRLAVASLTALIVCAAVGSALFYQFALHDRVRAGATDVVTRTIKEIQSDDPGFRLPIWERAWHRITAEPDHLLLGRGIGMYTVDEGLGAPDWLLRKTEAARHYPHNDHLEVLYEAGIFALVAFSILTAFPLVVSLKYWSLLSAEERAAISLYVFYLANVEISGSFAFSYEFQFFLALAIGVVSLKRKELSAAGTPPHDLSSKGPFKELTGPTVVH